MTTPIQSILDTLATEYDTPDAAVAECTVRIAEAAPPLIALLNRAADRGLSEERDRVLLFRALHILGAARIREACQPLLRLLRRAEEEVDNILGDTVTETLPNIMAGVFDGNAQALFTAIGDRRIMESARWSLLNAAAFLTFDARIERATTAAFLERFHAEKLAAPLDAAWVGWGEAVASLGLSALGPEVEEVWATFPRALASPSQFRELLADALAAPQDASRFEQLRAGYLEDALTSLDWARPSPEPDTRPWKSPPPPVQNPLRHVGRNDPCPCGSGKKFKKCCLNA